MKYDKMAQQFAAKYGFSIEEADRVGKAAVYASDLYPDCSWIVASMKAITGDDGAITASIDILPNSHVDERRRITMVFSADGTIMDQKDVKLS